MHYARQRMSNYIAPVRDTHFVIHETLGAHEMDTPGYDELDPEFTHDVLNAAARIANEEFAPLDRIGDQAGCCLENGVVRTPPGFGQAIGELRGGGWFGLEGSVEYGGQGMPCLMGTAAGEYFASANMSLSMYNGLTQGAIKTIEAYGTEAQKSALLPKLNAGDWFATMNLTEPHCGTDLGLLKTAARPLGNREYSISGEKIFISSGDHDLSENIVHLLLAKIPGGTRRLQGKSAFSLCPNSGFRGDGAVGPRNGISVSRIESKMGIKGNATCALRYENSIGQLLGEEHGGLRAMFTMMNIARLHVGLQGLRDRRGRLSVGRRLCSGKAPGPRGGGSKIPASRRRPDHRSSGCPQKSSRSENPLSKARERWRCGARP